MVDGRPCRTAAGDRCVCRACATVRHLCLSTSLSLSLTVGQPLLAGALHILCGESSPSCLGLRQGRNRADPSARVSCWHFQDSPPAVDGGGSPVP
ncbi:hypothetical protein chiPu_0024470 [Chiloscyllium punctatum]|uniref:Uncharacterized protein n=1 Tax=Chiloscyllium punctatum TaxID=137246 RepID=A0A401TDG5_CHIPU|nr:hypothetical protein [Chiloscyllium punctatum]